MMHILNSKSETTQGTCNTYRQPATTIQQTVIPDAIKSRILGLMRLRTPTLIINNTSS
ncbi:MAG: hypothetical protein J7623_08390 [Chitinophaga sp.]|uniref:hypothetical protein n=1 Tax=Chitinophaga sp. TaxID=1869181 RepID=UPI001B00C9C0|nr:hypothetical protein [Chitinophaga sp.]MBO9728640.1 hypothetical protein [Chitinophaga sp.]